MKKFLLFFIFCSIFLKAQSDCADVAGVGGALAVCGNTGISYTPANDGDVDEDLGGCLSGDEHFSVWYKFTIATSGTLTFTINPVTFSDDYDFAVYGPNLTCATLGTPIRCNYSAADGPTGLNATATNPSENAGGPPFSSQLNVVAGESYFLIVDNFSSSANGFSLSWGGTATLASPFNDPALTPNPFLAPGPGNNGILTVCTSPANFDFSTLSTGILNGNPNFEISYHNNSNDALTGTSPIIGSISVNTTNTYYYSIHYQDPANPNNPINSCRTTGTIKFIQGAITVNDATISACDNNNQGTGFFNLTSVGTAMYADPTATRQYYPTVADLNAGTNEITNPTSYSSTAPNQVFMKVTTTQNCTAYGTISLQFYPEVVTQTATLSSCFIEGNPNTAEFDLSTAMVSAAGLAKKYYYTLADAINDTNEISNPYTFISTSTSVWVRVTDNNICWGTAKINLEVIPPVYSSVLKDKIICIEDTTTLDAGPGFESYLWSTGATTQSITNVTVGEYWVILTTEGCPTLQKVKVIKSPSPVITNVEITNDSAIITVSGGTQPYQYSLDGTTWQDSNIFNEIPRGQNFVYVKDSYDCDPIVLEITVPNLVNAITPNGDGANDYIDYTALSYKKDLVLTVYNRYGNKMFQADKTNGYKWDGRSNGKRVITGTYWYSITWVEPNTNVPVKYTGWVLLKNRD